LKFNFREFFKVDFQFTYPKTRDMEPQELLESAESKLEELYSIHDYFFSETKNEKQVLIFLFEQRRIDQKNIFH